MACAICETRKPRRFCPGVRGDICTVCCGTEREVTVDCPLDCEFLQEARKHEKREAPDPQKIPNRDIRVTEEFLHRNEELLGFVQSNLGTAAFSTPGAVDYDVREALEALVRTYRTLQSGVLYESLPPNPLAANIYRGLQNAVAQFRQDEQRRLGLSRTRDADVLGILAFLQRLEMDWNNGRRRGRAFMDALRRFYSAVSDSAPPTASSLILP